MPSVSDFCIVILLYLSVIEHSFGCPDRWTTFKGSCYLFAHGGSLSFYEAEHYCTQQNGHLVHIDNQIEDLFVKDYLRSIKAGETWIGLTDEGTEGLWEWYGTHSYPSFFDWYPGEPNHAHDYEDCVAVKPGFDFRWFDVGCSFLKTPLCETAAETDVIG